MEKQAIFCSVLALGLHTQTEAKQKAKPNETPIIIIMADQLRADVIGKLTPNINTLKNDGVTFNRMYCASPLSVPSRGAFFTGKYPNNTGSIINGWKAEDQHYQKVKSGTKNLYQTLSENWSSWHMGKQHFFTEEAIDKDPNTKTRWIAEEEYAKWMKEQNVKPAGGAAFRGLLPELIANKHTLATQYSIPAFSKYEPGLKYYFDHFLTDSVVNTIQDYTKGQKPLLINAMFLAPHPPFDVPEPYYSMVKKDECSIPETVGVWYKDQSPLQLYNLTGFIGSRYTKEQWKEIWPKYLGLVNLLDDEVGRIIQALKEKGLYDKALIIFTSDHGEMLGSHSLWQKMCMYEESTKVPFVVKFPSDFKPAIRETNQLTSLIDVWPTITEYLKIDAGADVDGLSLMPVLKGGELSRDKIFIQYDGNGAYGNNQRCVVKGDYKLIIDTFKDEVFIELYNLKTDQLEKNNLAFKPEYKQQVLELIDDVKLYMKNSNDLIQLPQNVYEQFLNLYATNK